MRQSVSRVSLVFSFHPGSVFTCLTVVLGFFRIWMWNGHRTIPVPDKIIGTAQPISLFLLCTEDGYASRVSALILRYLYLDMLNSIGRETFCIVWCSVVFNMSCVRAYHIDNIDLRLIILMKLLALNIFAAKKKYFLFLLLNISFTAAYSCITFLSGMNFISSVDCALSCKYTFKFDYVNRMF